MDARSLQDVQAPIKDRYRSDPTAGMVLLRATGTLGSEHASCSVDVGRQLVEAVSIQPPAETALWHAQETCFFKPWSPAPA